MKIALIIDAWEPIIGGSQTHVRELVWRLVKNHECRIDIFTRALVDEDGKIYDGAEEYLEGRIRLFRVGPAVSLTSVFGRVSTLLTIANCVRKQNETEHYDLIHAHSILGGLIGKIASRLSRLPLLLTAHGSPNMDGGRNNFDAFVERYILTRIGYNQVISVGKRYLTYPNVNKNIALIPNGVDAARFDEVAAIKNRGTFKIIFVGRLDWVKGIDTLIEAIKLIKENHSSLIEEKKLEVHLVGYGFDMDKFKSLVLGHNLGELVLFRGKFIGENLIKEYKSSRLFILPSRCEGQPVTLLEAMAARLPVLTTYAADNSEIIDHDTGWKVKENNPEELAQKMTEVLGQPDEVLTKMGLAGHKKVSERHDWNLIAEKTFGIYAGLREKK